MNQNPINDDVICIRINEDMKKRMNDITDNISEYVRGLIETDLNNRETKVYKIKRALREKKDKINQKISIIHENEEQIKLENQKAKNEIKTLENERQGGRGRVREEITTKTTTTTTTNQSERGLSSGKQEIVKTVTNTTTESTNTQRRSRGGKEEITTKTTTTTTNQRNGSRSQSGQKTEKTITQTQTQSQSQTQRQNSRGQSQGQKAQIVKEVTTSTSVNRRNEAGQKQVTTTKTVTTANTNQNKNALSTSKTSQINIQENTGRTGLRSSQQQNSSTTTKQRTLIAQKPVIKEQTKFRKGIMKFRSFIETYKKELELYKLVNPIRYKLSEEKEQKEIKYLKKKLEKNRAMMGSYSPRNE